MLSTIRKISQNGLIKVSGTNGIVTVLKTLISIVANKVVAVYIGTSGVAMVGQLQSALNILTMVSSGGFHQGVTKYVAEYKNDKKTTSIFISTAFVSTCILSLFCGLVTLIFSRNLSSQIFLTDQYFSIIALLGASLILYNINILFISIINGFQQYRKYFKINLFTSILSAIFSIILVVLFKEYGALLSIILSQSLVVIFTYLMVKNEHWINSLCIHLFKKEKLRLLLKYTAIIIVGGTIWPVVKIILRTCIIENISIDEAGIWEATTKLNDYIAFFATGSFSIYLLPRLSEIKDAGLLKKEIYETYKIIIPFSLCLFSIIYLLREPIILILYSSSFIKIEEYLLLQMIGSFFWICKIIPMNFLLAKGMAKQYLSLELIFCLMYYVLAKILLPEYGVQGIQLSFTIYNFVYFLVNWIIIEQNMKNKKETTKSNK